MSRRFIYLGLVLFVTAAGASWYFYFVYLQNQKDQLAFFADALRNQNVVETVLLGGTPYIVDRGNITQNNTPVMGSKALKTMRLAYELATARRLPVLGLEGTDPKSLADAIEALAKVRDEIVGVLPEESKQYGNAVKESLYPLNFLRELAALESARQEFLASGSDANAKAYEKQLAATITMYKKDLAAYRAVAEEIAKNNENLARQALSSSASNPDGTAKKIGWIDSVLALETGFSGLEEFAVIPRNKCFRGDIASCAPEHEIAIIPLSESSTEPPSPSSAEEFARALKMQTFLQKVFKGASFEGGLIFELADASCKPALIEGSPLFTLGERTSPSGMGYRGLAYVSDMAFLSVSDVFSANPSAGAYLSEQGVAYTPLWKTAHYACPGVGSDIGVALALEAIATAAKEHPFSKEVIDSSSAAIADTEKHLGGLVVAEKDARIYLAQVQNAFAKDTHVSAEVLNRFTSLLLLYNAKSAGFDSVVWQIAAAGVRTVERAHAAPVLAEKTLLPVFLFSLESGFFPLFLGHNQLVAGVQTIPKSPDAASLPASSYLLFSQLPARGQTEESIASDLQFFFGERAQ